MKIASLAFVTIFAALGVTTVQAQNAPRHLKVAPATSETREYLSLGAMHDLFEIQSSRLAQQFANTQEVKDFANAMVKNHMESTQKLETAAHAQNITLSPPSKLDGNHQRRLDLIKTAEGNSFDRIYMQAQLDAHQKALDMHREYAKSGDNVQLKQVAGEIAEVVAHHLERARKISGDME